MSALSILMNQPVNPLGSQYPATWDELIGQTRAKAQLRIAAKSAASRGASMGHVLLYSPTPGVGKTALASLTAMELGTNIFLTTGAIKMTEARYIFDEMEDGDVLLIDEAQQLTRGNKAGADWLLTVMESRQIQGPNGMEDVPAVTIICTTTNKGALPPALLQRFQVVPDFAAYTAEEGAGIALEIASRTLGHLPPLGDEAAQKVARAARSHPRTILRLLEVLRDLRMVGEIGDSYLTDGSLPELALAFAGLTEDGLTVDALTVLSALSAARAVLGATQLSERTGLRGEALLEAEKLLLDDGLIAKTGRGRDLTKEGRARARKIGEQK